MHQNERVFHNGIMSGVLVGLAWGLDGVLMVQTGQAPVLSGISAYICSRPGISLQKAQA